MTDIEKAVDALQEVSRQLTEIKFANCSFEEQKKLSYLKGFVDAVSKTLNTTPATT